MEASLRRHPFVYGAAPEGGVDAELEAIQAQCDEAAAAAGGDGDGRASVLAPRYRPMLVCGLGVVALQQVTGQPSVLYYANKIFTDAGIGSSAAVGTALFKFVATMVAVLTVESQGRRKLLFLGISSMLVALLTMVGAFYGYDPDSSSSSSSSDRDSSGSGGGGDDGGGGGGSDDSDDGRRHLGARQVVIIASMFLYIGGYQVGFGPVAWTLISEVEGGGREPVRSWHGSRPA